VRSTRLARDGEEGNREKGLSKTINLLMEDPSYSPLSKSKMDCLKETLEKEKNGVFSWWWEAGRMTPGEGSRQEDKLRVTS